MRPLTRIQAPYTLRSVLAAPPIANDVHYLLFKNISLTACSMATCGHHFGFSFIKHSTRFSYLCICSCISRQSTNVPYSSLRIGQTYPHSQGVCRLHSLPQQGHLMSEYSHLVYDLRTNHLRKRRGNHSLLERGVGTFRMVLPRYFAHRLLLSQQTTYK